MKKRKKKMMTKMMMSTTTLISCVMQNNILTNNHPSQRDNYQEFNLKREAQDIDYDHDKKQIKQNKGSNNDYHFIGSSFGKNSIPGIKEIINHKHTNSFIEPTFTEVKYSEEVKLTESNDSNKDEMINRKKTK